MKQLYLLTFSLLVRSPFSVVIYVLSIRQRVHKVKSAFLKAVVDAHFLLGLL